MTRSTTGWSAAALATGRVNPTTAAVLMGARPEPTPHPFRFEPHGTGHCQRCGGELTAAWHV